MRTDNTPQAKIFKAVTLVTAANAIFQLVLSQFSIRMTMLSKVEITGITLFGFIIFGMVTLFAVTRMNDTAGGKLFAIAMNIVTALSATAYLFLVFQDEDFLRMLFYALNRQTRTYDVLLPLSQRIRAGIPLAGIILGTFIYYLSGLIIFLAMLLPEKKRKREEGGE
jgi:hypothetical protein